MKKDKVSSAVIRRLPRYYRHLNDLYLAGVERISSNALGRSMGLTASQIRQDLSCFGGEISEILGMKRGHTAVVVGAGNLGRALIENFHFDRSGVKLIAAFDIAPPLVGQEFSGTAIHHVDQLERYLSQNPASIGVLTVPRGVANQIAGRLVACGVKGIWNFTNIELNLNAPGVVVENVHFADSLLALNYMISEAP